MTAALAIAVHVVTMSGLWEAESVLSPYGTAEIFATPHGWVIDAEVSRILLRPEEFRPARATTA